MITVNRSIPKAKIKLLLFDLDGTLIDSRKDIANSINATRAHYHLAPLSEDQIVSYVGDGAPVVVRRAFGYADDQTLKAKDEDFLEEAYDYFLEYYREHRLDHTRAYHGVIEALTAIAANSAITMSVLTNKPVIFAKAIVGGLALDDFFSTVYGGNSFLTKKPHPFGANVLLREHGVEPHEAVMIGDSSVDMQTARNAGMWSCGCTFGLTPETLLNTPGDVHVDEPKEWIEVFA
jgi:phosphoglycolate phosphatase